MKVRVMGVVVVAVVCVLAMGSAARATTYYVDIDWTGTANGGIATPYTDIDSAVTAAETAGGAHTVVIATGTYKSDLNGGQESFGANGLALTDNHVIKGGYSGWDGAGTLASDFDWTTRVTRTSVIDLTLANTRAFVLTGASYKKPLLDGLTIQNANHTLAGGAVYYNGGFQAGGRINDCLITSNTTTGDGGGVYMSLSYAGNGTVVTNSEFSDNSGSNGGALYITAANGTSTVLDTIFDDNSASGRGGGIYIAQNTVVDGCSVYDNTATSYGGGIYSQKVGTIRQSILYGNDTGQNGGAVATEGFHAGPLKVENSLLYENTGGYAVYFYAGNYDYTYGAQVLFSTIADNDAGVYDRSDDGQELLRLINSIVASNTGVGVNTVGHTPIIQYSDVWGNGTDYAGTAAAGTGCISLNPAFVSPAADDYSFKPGGSCTNAGTDLGIYVDLVGEVRPLNGGFDMGAYEVAVPIAEPAGLGLMGLAMLSLRKRRT